MSGPEDQREGPVKSHLERLINQYGRAEQLAVGRVRRWVSTMVLLGAFDRVQRDSGPQFVLKGGVAIELRLRAGARATQDVDVIFRGPPDDLIEALDEALSTAYHDFTFNRGGPIERGPHATGFDVRMDYQSRAWATVRLEISGPDDPSVSEVDLLPAIELDHFQLIGPHEIACLPLRFQIAQKIHAVTERPIDRDNNRFRDLVDLLLLEDLIDDFPALRNACAATFERRGTHSWPPSLTVPDSWQQPYRSLAIEIGFDVIEVEEAAAEVRGLISRIASSES